MTEDKRPPLNEPVPSSTSEPKGKKERERSKSLVRFQFKPGTTPEEAAEDMQELLNEHFSQCQPATDQAEPKTYSVRNPNPTCPPPEIVDTTADETGKGVIVTGQGGPQGEPSA